MPKAALREILTLAGLEPDTPAAFAGADPVLPTRYRLASAGAAAIAASGIAAARLAELRGVGRQSVAVDLRAAAAAMRSSRYLAIDGRPVVSPWHAVSGFHQVRHGRFVNRHCNFANHLAAALAVLGVAAERQAVSEAARGWDGVALEDAVHEAGGCAGLARGEAEWRSHPQAQALESEPLIELRPIGEAPPEPLPAGRRPLEGIRALDLTRVLAGPTCARTLAEHGADVLKITAAHLSHSGDIELDTGLGKLSAYLDLREEAGVARLRALLAEADVFSQSYRPGTLARRGLSPEAAAALRPGIVFVSLSAWGEAGPWCRRRGFDSIVQTVSGIAAAEGEGGTPKLVPASAIDYVSGYLMAFGAMAALERRAREGGSWLVRVSLARTGKWITERGRVDAAALAGLPPDLPAELIARLSEETVSPAGRIRHLKPIVELSLTPPYWARPPVPLGYHPPAWPARAAAR